MATYKEYQCKRCGYTVELLTCKYYKGEPECPCEKNAGFWMYEKMWVEASLNEPKRIEEWEAECKFEHLESMAEEYNLKSADNFSSV